LSEEYIEAILVIDTPIPDARTLAAAILDAWGSNNLPVLRRRLALAAHGALPVVRDTWESERLELVGAIAGAWRLLLESGEPSSAEHYLPLLRHLAAPPTRILDYAFSC
jgi:hypothetical protein